MTFGRELNGVIQKVQKDLADTDLVADQLTRDLRVDIDHEVEVFVLHTDGNDVDDVVDDRSQLITDIDDLHLTGFDLTEVEDIVNDRQERVTCALDVSRVFTDARVDIVTKDHLGHTDDRVHRGSDLMGHVREEVRLCLRSGNRFFLLDLNDLKKILGTLRLLRKSSFRAVNERNERHEEHLRDDQDDDPYHQFLERSVA